jgi:hypothetical protein
MPEAAVSTTPAAPPPAAVIAAQPAAPPARAGAISDAHYDGLDLAAQAGYARVRKGPDGGAERVHRDNLSKGPADGVTTGADGGVVDPKQMAAGQKIKIAGADGKTFELDAADIASLWEQKAAAELRKASVPADGNGYELKLPTDFEMPAGVEFKIDPTAPIYADYRAWALSKGFDQATFSEGIGLFASHAAREEAVIRDAAARELAQLGANATKIVRGWEKVIQRFASHGAAEFRNHGREPPQQAGRVSDETYAAMTPSQKVDYARGFPQKQFNGDARDDARR